MGIPRRLNSILPTNSGAILPGITLKCTCGSLAAPAKETSVRSAIATVVLVEMAPFASRTRYSGTVSTFSSLEVPCCLHIVTNIFNDPFVSVALEEPLSGVTSIKTEPMSPPLLGRGVGICLARVVQLLVLGSTACVLFVMFSCSIICLAMASTSNLGTCPLMCFFANLLQPAFPP